MSDATGGSAGGGGGLGGLGSFLAGAGGFLKDIFGTTTDIDQSGTVANTGTVTGLTDLNSLVTNSTSPAIIAALTGEETNAENAATDPNATNALVKNIFRQSAISFAPIAGGANRSGGYAGSTLQTLTSKAQADATGQAATSVLNYKTSMAQLAASIGDALGKLQSTTSTGTIQATTQKTNSVQDTNTGSSQSGGGIIPPSQVCTELRRQGRISRYWWAVSVDEFVTYPIRGQISYYYWSGPLLRELKKNPNSIVSNLIAHIFYKRTQFIVWRAKKHASFTILGALAHAAMWLLCYIVMLIPGNYRLAVDLFKKEVNYAGR